MPGDYEFRFSANGFESTTCTVNVGSTGAVDLNVTLQIGETKVTVTAETGQIEEARNVPQSINVIDSNEILERATSFLAQVGEEEAGLNVQRTSPTIGAIVVRDAARARNRLATFAQAMAIDPRAHGRRRPRQVYPRVAPLRCGELLVETRRRSLAKIDLDDGQRVFAELPNTAVNGLEPGANVYVDLRNAKVFGAEGSPLDELAADF